MILSNGCSPVGYMIQRRPGFTIGTAFNVARRSNFRFIKSGKLFDGEPVAHLAVAPLFTAGACRATRLAVMPEWQGIGGGTRFLAVVCEYRFRGHGRCGKELPVFFHTSQPQLCGTFRHSKRWKQTAASLYGANKAKSGRSLVKSAAKKGNQTRLLRNMEVIFGQYRHLNMQVMMVGDIRAKGHAGL